MGSTRVHILYYFKILHSMLISCYYFCEMGGSAIEWRGGGEGVHGKYKLRRGGRN